MFTGIITELGMVDRTQRASGCVRLTVRAPQSAAELHVNDSVSVNGVCQTVVALDRALFSVEAVEETLSKTTLGDLVNGDSVNLELPLRLQDRIGGHLVAGHVDGVGKVEGVIEQAGSRLIRISYPVQFARYLIPVGSIAVDGISLTVARLEEGLFTASIIPHTLAHTTLGKAAKGLRVNLEFDLVGKYIERMVSVGRIDGRTGGITAEKLGQWGISP
jgi:riboflavin synthase